MTVVAVAVESTSMHMQTESWKKLSVDEFLRRVNWSNHKPEVPSSQVKAQSVSVTELHYQLSVGQFFSAIPWNGEAKTDDAEPDLQLPLMEESPSGTQTADSLPLELPDLDEFADSATDGSEDLTLDDFFDSFSDF